MSVNNKISKIRWKTSNTAVFNCSYHFIWSPKFRRPVLTDKISTRLQILIEEKCEAMNWTIKALEIMPDHVHLFISAEPSSAPQFIIGQIKGYTSRFLRSEFPELKRKLPTLWSRSYYVDTVGCLREDTIKTYIEQQKNESKYFNQKSSHS